MIAESIKPEVENAEADVDTDVDNFYKMLRQMYAAQPAHFKKALELLACEDKTAIPDVIDEQTGLYSKQYFENNLLSSKISEAKQSGAPVCYAILDVDHFHEYNKTNGHDKGDEVLKNIASIINYNTRQEDRYDATAPRRKDAVAGRIGGGEEFGIVYSCNLEGAVKACERLRTKIQQQTGVTVSIGVAEYSPQMTPQMTVQELRVQSDNALYDAKANGRNQTRYTPVDQTHEIN